MRGLITRLGLAVAVLCCAAPAWALDPAVSLHDYRHDTWRRKDGAPASISTMAQTTDGWLWVGTENGLYRFDGLNFERYQSPTGQRLLSIRISTLTATPSGDLLVGHLDGGINLIRKGEIVPLPAWKTSRVETVYDIVADNDGTVWIGTRAGLVRYSKGQWHNIGSSWGLPQKTVEEGTLDQYGQLWVLADGEWYKLDRKAQRFYPTGRRDESGAFFSPDGAMWRRSGKQVVRVASGQPGPVLPRLEAQRYMFRQNHDMFDADGNLWLLHSPNGIARIRKQDIPNSSSFDPSQLPAERLSQPWQLSSPQVIGMLEDREDNLWAMTISGLERFRNQRIRTISLPEGAEHGNLAADAQGRIWAGAQNLEQLWDIARQPPPPVVSEARRLAVTGRAGALLSAGPQGIERHLGGRIERIPLPPQCPQASAPWVNRLAEDRDALWAGMRSCGLFRYRNGVWVDGASLGVTPKERVMASDRDGAMWFGYRDGEIQRYLDGKVSSYAFAAGGSLGPIRFIDTQQETLISGAEGTAVLRNGQFERLRAALPETLVNLAGLVIQPNGDRWLHTGLGLALVRAADWRASISDPRQPLRMDLFDSADGYPGAPMLYASIPNGALDSSGRVWFVGTDGIGVLDPQRMYRNRVPPSVEIGMLSVDNHSYAPQAGLLLPEHPMRLDIGFAALSLTKPEQMQVWYKLDGVDRSWQLAGTRRKASYSHLGPGSYRFSVRAANADGVWSTEDATLTFAVQPAFTQTVWFYLLCAGAAAGLAYGLYLMRLRQLVRRLNAVLGARLLERERIARALHDSLLQSVQALVLRFGALGKSLPPDSPARQQLDALLYEADGVIVEGRNAVMGLRLASVHGGDIALAFKRLVERMQAEHQQLIAFNTRGTQRRLDPLAWEEVYHLGAEAVLNACRHSGASRIVMELDFGLQSFALTVRDNGKGLSEDILRDGQRDGHWGLVGMHERAAALHGTLLLTPAQPHGLELQLTVPAARAYDSRHKPSWRRRVAAWLSRA
ncbi:two-component regulator propeller domain-containing protein [Duganella sp.]|uniref:sensor histidine kinase n=1 Tax=Duganella sp. TaxID=1904440 RepID=UPI0031DE0E44